VDEAAGELGGEVAGAFRSHSGSPGGALTTGGERSVASVCPRDPRVTPPG
jgi:hypothetical protein